MSKIDEIVLDGSEPSLNGSGAGESLVDRAKASTTARPVLYLPDKFGIVERPECHEEFYKGCAATGKYFLRDDQFVYVERHEELGSVLHALEKGELLSEIHRVFEVRKKSYDKKGNEIASRALCTKDEASAILEDRGPRQQYSLPLRLLAASPVLVERNGKPVTLGAGYHPDEGGVYVTGNLDIPTLSLPEAKDLLLDLFADYDFVSPSDRSRAIAQAISPALKLGNLLKTDFPLDVGLGDQQQAGKTHRMKINTAIYGENAFSLTKTQGGVGSLDESIATALLSGKPFILVDNARVTSIRNYLRAS
jgi:hypothetical protein